MTVILFIIKLVACGLLALPLTYLICETRFGDCLDWLFNKLNKLFAIGKSERQFYSDVNLQPVKYPFVYSLDEVGSLLGEVTVSDGYFERKFLEYGDMHCSWESLRTLDSAHDYFVTVYFPDYFDIDLMSKSVQKVFGEWQLVEWRRELIHTTYVGEIAEVKAKFVPVKVIVAWLRMKADEAELQEPKHMRERADALEATLKAPPITG